ncbi:hypothetical protein PENSPDRAFT_676174 [Peniophora sp. CONT]|nr:hypothetical protein PENSPDRAFT_676174 [Peniophora sp. CONT]
MKVFTTEQELRDLDKATYTGGAEGAAAGLAISIPGVMAASRYSPAFGRLPLQAKAFAVILFTGPIMAIRIEQRMTQFDEAHNWTGATRKLLENQRDAKEIELENLHGWRRMKQWAINNQYKVILGSWALSMSVASAIIFRDKHQSTSQKVVQARMWAQGLTVGILIGAGILTHSAREEAAKHHTEDHSWRQLVS